MLRFISIFITILFREIDSFKQFNIAEEMRTVPAWTEYKYLESPPGDQVIREYILQEQDQRTYLLCPRGFVIAQLGLALLLSPDQVEQDERMRGKTSVFRSVWSISMSRTFPRSCYGVSYAIKHRMA